MNQTKIILLLTLIFILGFSYAITNTNTSYSSGVYNGDFENAPVYVATQNQANWINGTQTGSSNDYNYGWRYSIFNATPLGIVDFNAVEKYSGNYSLKLSMLDSNGATGRIGITPANLSMGTNANAFNQRFLIPIKPSTNYNLSYVIKRNLTNLNSRGTFVAYTQHKSDYTMIASSQTAFLNGDVNWTRYDLRFNSSSLASYFLFSFRIEGETGDVFIDDVRLEEVSNTSLVGQATGRPSIVVTGVSDFNAIDQADTNNSTSVNVGNTTSNYSVGQCFTPTQNKFTGIVFQKGADEGTFTGDVIISLRDSNATNTVPDRINPALAQVTIPNATWTAYPINTDWRISLPATIDANGTKKYCVDWNVTTNDAVNYTKLKADSSVGYSGGTRVDYNAISDKWTSVSADLYFKTLFEKQSSAFDLNVCSNGDTICDFKSYDIDVLANDENYTINPSNAPLFYLGDNNVYFMMHSDSDFNNKTPSMMASISYTFDKPTTNLTNQKGTVDNTRDISLDCSNGLTGNCNNTLYSFNGSTYTTYNNPLTLNTGTYTLYYYSTGDNNNTESINTQIIIVTPQGSVATCSIVNLFPIILIFGAITVLSGIIFVKKAITENDLKYVINYVLMLIIGIVIIINLLPIFC